MLNYEKQETKGRNAIIALFDAGSFVETGAFIRRRGESEPYDAVITGYGSVDGKLAFAFVQDSDRKAGALDEVGANKIEKLYAEALSVGAPVIGVFDSAGAVVMDGAPALTAYGRVMKCVSDASGIIPQIALIEGICTGMGAVIAAMFDMAVTVSEISKISFRDDDTQASTLSAINHDTVDAAVASVRELIALLPRNNRDVADTEPTDAPARAVAADTLKSRDLVTALADNSCVISLYDAFGTEMITALCRIGGRVCGVVATDATVNGGKLTPKGARKAARLVSFCDSFSIPVITLVDSEGVAEKTCCEPSPFFAKLAKAYITANTAKISVVVGKAYGAAFTLLGSRALGSDLALALPESVISVLPPETAVAFLQNDEITEDKPRAAKEAEWMEQIASPVRAAESGDIDDIVVPAELRARLCSALYMLAEKADATPDRKHGVPAL